MEHGETPEVSSTFTFDDFLLEDPELSVMDGNWLAELEDSGFPPTELGAPAASIGQDTLMQKAPPEARKSEIDPELQALLTSLETGTQDYIAPTTCIDPLLLGQSGTSTHQSDPFALPELGRTLAPDSRHYEMAPLLPLLPLPPLPLFGSTPPPVPPKDHDNTLARSHLTPFTGNPPPVPPKYNFKNLTSDALRSGSSPHSHLIARYPRQPLLSVPVYDDVEDLALDPQEQLNNSTATPSAEDQGQLTTRKYGETRQTLEATSRQPIEGVLAQIGQAKPTRTIALDKPLSVMTKDWPVPLGDTYAKVHRSAEQRQAEVNNKHNGKVPRPLNAFMLYRSTYAERVKEYTGENNAQIVSQITGASWSMESREVKELYEEYAEIDKQNHQKAHPHYEFKPVPKRPANKKRKDRDVDDCQAHSMERKDRDYEAGSSRNKRAWTASVVRGQNLEQHRLAAAAATSRANAGKSGYAPRKTELCLTNPQSTTSRQQAFEGPIEVVIFDSRALPARDGRR
ncbi:hypothetical protein EPUS_07645 [Endocarpon pusillum Z07020]|uniref:HMG box domain-containing protein n=1 Tax=Endocarpon pusillum (strain Z07020 / HMAS-L-300199) TaxID=1263415 RepID=U1I0U9_ENDPU|nr:uncharacterized protein EPUS_07645 [Endocarpon pusillum Z07020]ERF76855.1 hypothetical protein EPUS_07645 [Endocarpon pusillum Z07020]